MVKSEKSEPSYIPYSTISKYRLLGYAVLVDDSLSTYKYMIQGPQFPFCLDVRYHRSL